MKKILLIVLTLLLLSGCTNVAKNEDNSQNNYLNLIDTINNRTDFIKKSSYFDITADIVKTNEGYRFYVIIDNPKNAMYDVEAIAIEKDVNYSSKMAANVGVFEGNKYNMIPGQSNVEKGYVSGLSISGLTESSSPELYVLVQWYSNQQEIHQEYVLLNPIFEDYNG